MRARRARDGQIGLLVQNGENADRRDHHRHGQSHSQDVDAEIAAAHVAQETRHDSPAVERPRDWRGRFVPNLPRRPHNRRRHGSAPTRPCGRVLRARRAGTASAHRGPPGKSPSAGAGPARFRQESNQSFWLLDFFEFRDRLSFAAAPDRRTTAHDNQIVSGLTG